MQNVVRRAFSTQVASAKKTTQTSFVKNLFTDFGNIPLVAANSAGCALVLVFAGRKALYHPDIGFADAQRLNNKVQNENAKRLEDADVFRQQHIRVAAAMEPLAQPIISYFSGNKVNIPKWKLSFAQTPVEDLVPLERTDFFDDGLYLGKKPSKLALNEDNQDVTPYQL